MIKIKTEFGLIEATLVGAYYQIAISKLDGSDHRSLGWVYLGSLNANNQTAVLHSLSKFSNLFLKIMRFEAKLGLFQSIPLSNPFRDAVLRMQIENAGLTFSVRKYIEEYNSNHVWTTYPKFAEHFEIDDSRSTSSIALLTPYGEFYLEEIDTYSFHVIKKTDNIEKILGLIRVPYDELGQDLMFAAFSQMLDIILTDVMDIIWKKTFETTKRSGEAIKYMFNYDKLRIALRKRGIE